MHVVRKILAVIVGVCIAALMLEGLLRIFPVSSGAYMADPDESWPIATLIPHSTYTYSAGWNLTNVQHGSVNNLGYVAPFDYQAGESGVVVIGDSFVQSLMNRYQDTLQGALNDYLLRQQSVMGFGTPGASMAHFLGTAEIIKRKFSPQWVVVLITARDYTEGFMPSAGYYQWAAGRNPPIELVPVRERSALAKRIRTLALVQYTRSNLKVEFSDLVRFHPAEIAMPESANTCETDVLTDTDSRIIHGFVQGWQSILDIPASRVILVFDSDRTAIYAGNWPDAAECQTLNVLARKALMADALKAGMHIVDSGPIFADYFRATKRRLDYSPVDPHWNGIAHRLIAEKVAKVINEQDSVAK